MSYALNSFAARSHQLQSSPETSISSTPYTLSASDHGVASQQKIDQVASQPPLQRRISPQCLSLLTELPSPELSFSQSAGVSRSPSRSGTPTQYYASGGLSSSSYASDDDSEPTSSLIDANTRVSVSSSWRSLGHRSRNPYGRRRRFSRDTTGRTVRRQLRRLVRHPCFPRQPTSIILSLLIFTIIAIILTFLLMHILNPDKAALPWRIYCSLPLTSTSPPSPALSPTHENYIVQLPIGVDPISYSGSLMADPLSLNNLDEVPPVGIFLGVFSVDSAIERRMLIRSTWASHERSRSGAGTGDGGKGTSRTIVRFILGKSRSDWERRIQLESDVYNDMIHLPISENMNSGKTHAFFTWAAENAWVPPRWQLQSPILSYSNYSTVPPPRLAPHDPIPDLNAVSPNWVRPDFVVKADDDSFVMLAELESRLRVQFEESTKTSQNIRLGSESVASIQSNIHTDFLGPLDHLVDPLIYWGYLVKNRFMAGELYSLSWSLVTWIASESTIKTMTHGAEDKGVAKWMRLHPRANDIRWVSDRCWIYDHPRAGTVYSHGFLFPSEVRRVRKSVLSLLKPLADTLSPTDDASLWTKDGSSSTKNRNDTITYSLPSPLLPTTPSYSYSSVSKFGTHYTFPLTTLSIQESVEALVEGSEMSTLFEGGPKTAAQAWARRESRETRYEGSRVGGTVVVHFIKRHEWFMETALALLGGDEIVKNKQKMGKDASDAPSVVNSVTLNSTHSIMEQRH